MYLTSEFIVRNDPNLTTEELLHKKQEEVYLSTFYSNLLIDRKLTPYIDSSNARAVAHNAGTVALSVEPTGQQCGSELRRSVAAQQRRRVNQR